MFNQLENFATLKASFAMLKIGGVFLSGGNKAEKKLHIRRTGFAWIEGRFVLCLAILAYRYGTTLIFSWMYFFFQL